MKTKLLLYLSGISFCTLAQNPVPNSSFENWSTGTPVSWYTNNLTALGATPVTQSSEANTGNSGVRMAVVNYFNIPLGGGINTPTDFNVSQDYPNFSFYYKCSLTSSDRFVVTYNTKNSSLSNIGGGVAVLDNNLNTSVYTKTTTPIVYGLGTGAAKGFFGMAFNNAGAGSTLTIGSYVILDDIALEAGTPTGIADAPSNPVLSLGSCFPNPASGISLIPFSLSERSAVRIELYNLDGKMVQEVLNTELKGGSYKAEMDASRLSAGPYLCKLSANGTVCYSKILVR